MKETWKMMRMVWLWLRGRCEECGGPMIRDTFEVGGLTGPTTIRYCPRCDGGVRP